MGLDKFPDNNNLIKLLRTVTSDEWKEYEKFVSSPFFNEGRNYLPLLKVLRKFHPDYDSDEFSKEYVYKKLFPGKEFKDSVLSSMFSRLYSISEEFLIQIALKNNKYMIKEKLMINELSTRGISLKVNNLIDDNMNFLKEKPFGIFDFKNLNELKFEILNFYIGINNREKVYDSMVDLMKYSAYSYFFDLNFYYSILYSQKNFWKEEFDGSFISRLNDNINIEAIVNLIEKEDLEHFIPIKLFYLSYMATKYPEEDRYYFDLKSLYLKESDKFDMIFKEILLNNLWRLSSMKMVQGKNDFKYEAFEIRKLIIEQNIIALTAPYMKISDFRSTLVDALNVGELAWAEKFIEDYLDKLHPDFREDVSNYSRSRIFYEKGDFDKALEFAGKVNINQITFKLDIKNIVSKIYYDTGSTEPLFSLLNSYYQLINNSDSKNADYLLRHKNFVKYLRRLADIQSLSENKTELEILRNTVDKDNVSAKSWLLKKVNGLILK